MERVWGGRNLERLYGKSLPADVLIGESWEITDRPESVSVIATGPLAGKSLRWLMEHHREELLGLAPAQHGRFPLLIKILDAQDKLSLQVHPPAHLADRLGGEPKTEFWYVADATPGAELFVGLRRGITRAEFERRIGEGTVAGCFHRIRVKRGDAMFLPSGRVHALGAGNVILEIQQNSDTTYRVFDWNRLGLDGKPRELHVKESLACIDFDDFEPGLVPAGRPDLPIRVLVDHPLFNIQWRRLTAGESAHTDGHRLQILAGLDGELEIAHGPEHVALRPGQFCLVPACLPQVPLRTGATTAWLHVWAGKAE